MAHALSGRDDGRQTRHVRLAHEAAVIAIAHPQWQEPPLRVVVKRAGAQVTREELLDFLASRVVKWWLPDDVAFVDSLPHTATGKLLKTRLREQFRHYLVETTS